MRTEAKIRAKKAISGMIVPLWIVTILISLPSGILASIETSVDTVLSLRHSGSAALTTGLSFLFSVLVIACALAMIPAQVGLAAKYLHVSRGGLSSERSVWDFYRKRIILEPIKAYLIASLYIFIGFILFIVPGIILSLRYCMLGYVFAEEPEISYRDALNRCKDLTDGRKGELFVFFLSFIGWDLLCALTLGILSIYVIPYENTALAAMYDQYCKHDGFEPPHAEEEEVEYIFDE